MYIEKTLAQEFGIQLGVSKNIIKLIEDGCTVPFIARYRKDMTDNMDDQKVRKFCERLSYLTALNKKRDAIITAMSELGVLNRGIKSQILRSQTQTELDNIYRPFRPKKRSKASIAKELGVMPIAEYILGFNSEFDVEEFSKGFIDAKKGLTCLKDCIDKAMDIVVEIIADNPKIRNYVFNTMIKSSKLRTTKIKGEENSVYKMYYNYENHIKKVNGHNILAINRAEKMGFIKVSLVVDNDLLETKSYAILCEDYEKPCEKNTYVLRALKEALKKSIAPCVQREVRAQLAKKAYDNSIKLFSQNLKQLLLQPPLKNKIVLGVDPAFKTGCKLAVVDRNGKLLHFDVIHPHPPENETFLSERTLLEILDFYKVDLVALGNGKASMETEMFLKSFEKQYGLSIDYVVVNEAGASVYSASSLASEEFPNIDVSIRSAVSIARRVQDPLAELVKIEPRSIGIGQYQYDLPKKELDRSLNDVVEDCVNTVGVDLNTASLHLLARISGLNKKTASNIIKFRDENGTFKNRRELLNVSGLGKKAFEQSVGFLRISGGDNFLDNTAIHPESYDKAEMLLKSLDENFKTINKTVLKKFGETADKLDINALSEKLNIGIHTLSDIVENLKKPKRDPRTKKDIENTKRQSPISIDSLKIGDSVKGTVRNVIDFGAFVDIGIGMDALLHISKMSKRFISEPSEVMSVGDNITVNIIDIDLEKNKVSISLI